MSSIQEIAEELVNLTVKEVNELAMVMKNDMDIPVVRYEESKYNKGLSPKQYGMNLKKNKKKKKMIMNIEELKTAYKVITKIMEENHLTKDNSFNRVKNFISNKLCDSLVDKTIKII